MHPPRPASEGRHPAGSIADLMARHAGNGHVAWIGVRPKRRAPVVPLDAATVTESGLAGDHAPGGMRAVTLIQSEHLPVIAALAHRDSVEPGSLRRNVVVGGLNLAALRHAEIRIGTAALRITGPCPPCSRMEEALGPGGYNAMRGHGGWYAEVLRCGRICVGDPTCLLTA